MKHTSALSSNQQSSLDHIYSLPQTTSSQIRRLVYYAGTPKSNAVISRRHLTKLTDLGLVSRMWGIYGGERQEYVYQHPDSTTRAPSFHHLDVAELYVQLVEAGRAQNLREAIRYWPEPASHTYVGAIKLRPDAYVEIGTKRFFIEVDRGGEAINSGEHEAQLTKQMRAYMKAIDSGHWDEEKNGLFPSIVWTAMGEKRFRYIERIINKLGERQLFSIVLFDEAATKIVRAAMRK